MIYRFALAHDKWSVQVNVLLNKCKQNTTSLSLLAGRTISGVSYLLMNYLPNMLEFHVQMFTLTEPYVVTQLICSKGD